MSAFRKKIAMSSIPRHRHSRGRVWHVVWMTTRAMRLLIGLGLFAACTSSAQDQDIVGPFSGPMTRFVVDRITLPTDNASAFAMGDDLTGSGAINNQLGNALGMLSSEGLTNLYGADMIAAGAIASSVVLQAEDLDNATQAAVTYYGADGTTATLAGGAIVNGVFTSNRTRSTRVPGAAALVLPVFGDADPSSVELHAMEIDL